MLRQVLHLLQPFEVGAAVLQLLEGRGGKVEQLLQLPTLVSILVYVSSTPMLKAKVRPSILAYMWSTCALAVRFSCVP